MYKLNYYVPVSAKEETKQAELNYLRFINLAERINKRLEVEKSIKNESSAV